MERFLFIASLILSAHFAWAQELCPKPKSDLEQIIQVIDLEQTDEFKKQFCLALEACWFFNDVSTDPKIVNKMKISPECKNFHYEDTIDSKFRVNQAACKLTSAELLAVATYISNWGYTCYNIVLRDKRIKIKTIDPLINSLKNALEKLPNYEGYVRRGADLPPQVRQQHKVGKFITYEAFTSSSTGKAFPGKDSFIIYSKTGKPIMALGGGENEVLFRPKTRFKILDRYKEGDQNMFVMREVLIGENKENVLNEEKKILEEIRIKRKTQKTSNYEWQEPDPDAEIWNCPIDPNAPVEKVIKQKRAPNFR